MTTHELPTERAITYITDLEPGWDAAGITVKSAEVMRPASRASFRKIDIHFRYKGDPYRLWGELRLEDDYRERSMDKYRAEKRRQQAEDEQELLDELEDMKKKRQGQGGQ